MDTSKAQELIDKCQKGTLSAQEEAMLEGWYLKLAAEQKIDISEEDLLKKKTAIWSKIQSDTVGAKIIRFRSLARIAAAAIVIITIGAFYFYQNDNKQEATSILVRNDIIPGGNKAYLKLANGKMIALNTTANGQIANQAGTSITKTGSGQLVYAAPQQETGNPGESNTIITPHGGQWQLLLPDGTKVWLNAASSLTYPVSFAALKDRRVELNGEAYFEVAKDKKHPFFVHTSNQLIEVFGTHFNVNAYADQLYTKTTLLEGSVGITVSKPSSVNNTQAMLKPGEQSILNNGTIQVSAANTEAAVAWKNALFYFENDDLDDIMKRISRWYDVKIVYRDVLTKHELFSGRVSRAQNVSEVLKMLSLTGAAKFTIEGRDIIVTK